MATTQYSENNPYKDFGQTYEVGDTGMMTMDINPTKQANAEMRRKADIWETANNPSTTIGTDTLNGGQMALTVPQKEQTDYSSILASLNEISKSAKELQKQQDSGSDYLKLAKEYLGDSTPPPSGAEGYASTLGKTQAQIIQEREASQKEYNDLSAQLRNITAGAEVSKQQLESAASGKDITTTFLGRQQQEVNRQAAIKGLPIAAQLAVVEGNLKLAQDHLDKYFDLQQQDVQNTYNYNQDLRDKVFQFATSQEQARLNEKDKQETREYNDRVNNLNQAQSWATTAIENGQGSLATQIMSLDPKNPNYQTKLAQLAGQIQAKPTGLQPTTIKSGNLVLSETAISQGQQTLDASRGQPYTNEKGENIAPTGRDAEYVNSKLYLNMLEAWKEDGGLEQDFFTQYPPKNYLNPNDNSIPQYIKDKIKAVDAFSSF